jgi:hypothetical protein
MLLFSVIGAAVPILFGKETVGQIELVTETAPELARRAARSSPHFADDTLAAIRWG